MKKLPSIFRRLSAACRRPDMLLLLLILALGWLIMLRYGGQESVPVVSTEEPVWSADDEAPAAVYEVPDMPKSGPPVRFLMYNVQNYFVAKEQQRSRYACTPKPAKTRNAVAEVIASVQPDVVGLIEIGGPLALADLQVRLSARRLRYEHTFVLTREGEDRALALLSRYPIVRNQSVANYGLYGRNRRKLLRGILDVTIQAEDGRQFRVVGVHLKSRVAADAAAADHLRAAEASTLALYLQRHMKAQPSMPLLVFGDWNDGPGDASLRALSGGMSKGTSLTRLSPRDSDGEEWTFHYEQGQAYYTFDQMYVNSVLRRRMGKDRHCGIVDIPMSEQASDHRAVWCELR